jgi:putative hydrolase
LDFPVNIEKIVETAYKTNTLLELNNQVFAKESQNHKFLESYKRVVTLSKHYNHPLIIGSDAHIATKIGEDTAIMRVSEDIGLTKDIIINNKPNELLRWMKS